MFLIIKLLFILVQYGFSFEIKIGFTGDIMMARYVSSAIISNQNFYTNITHHLPAKNFFLIGNLEAPFYPPERIKLTHIKQFATPPEFVKYLKKLNFKLVALANNHIYDSYMDGIKTTINTLEKNKILYCGAGINKDPYMPVYLSFSNFSIAFFSTTYALNMGSVKKLRKYVSIWDAGRIIRNIKKARKKAKYIVMLYHGDIDEYKTIPSRRKRKRFKLLLKNGVDIIIGTHPHILQPAIITEKNIIFYSLGNFIFDMKEERFNLTVIPVIKFTSKEFKLVNIIPVEIKNFFPEICKSRRKIEKTFKFLKLKNYEKYLYLK